MHDYVAQSPPSMKNKSLYSTAVVPKRHDGINRIRGKLSIIRSPLLIQPCSEERVYLEPWLRNSANTFLRSLIPALLIQTTRPESKFSEPECTDRLTKLFAYAKPYDGKMGRGNHRKRSYALRLFPLKCPLCALFLH